MLLRLLYEDQIAQASYLIGCPASGEALIIDPNRDVAQYIERAAQAGLRIVAVAETHIHADFVSGARELAACTGATLYLSAEGPAEWQYEYAADAGATLLHEGDSFPVGNLRITVWHTPGHTPEHLVYIVTDAAHANEPMGIVSGDFVFVGAVGRPDLLERAAGQTGTMEAGARDLFRSLNRFRTLPDWLQVWPGHGAGSACGKALGAVPQTTVGYETRFNEALGFTDEGAFVTSILAGQTDPPPYFARMKAINKRGPAPLGEALPPPQLSLPELQQHLASGTVVVDTRPASEYARQAIPGTLNLPYNSGFLNWAGWLLTPEQPFALLVDDANLPAITRLLRLIGLDHPVGYWPTASVADWQAAGGVPATIEPLTPTDLAAMQAQQAVTVLDVRNASERSEGYLANSTFIPLGQLPQRLGELPPTGPLVVHCQSGIRSAIAASLLLAQPGRTVYDLPGGFNAWQEAGLPVTTASDQPVGSTAN